MASGDEGSLANPEPGSGPQALPFSLREHKVSIIIFWTAIAAEVCFIPLALYYGLWFGTTLYHGILFAIITSVFGFVSGVEYTRRGFQLVRPNPKYRPAGSGRWQFDATQLALAIPYTFMTAILVGFSIPYEPVVRGLATPFAVGDILLGVIFTWSALAHTRGWNTPVRLSSTRKGELTPPFAFVVLEDVLCVDGGVPEFRAAAKQRWDASPVFQRLLLNLTWFWGISSIVIGIVVLLIVGLVEPSIGYGIGWGVPSLHAALGAIVTWRWTVRDLGRERRLWTGSSSNHRSDK